MKKTNRAVNNKLPGISTGPVGDDLAQPDERDQTPETGTTANRKTLGPRMVIQQAARDIAQGQQDTDLHGVPSNVPGPAARQPTPNTLPTQGGDRRSYAEDQTGKARGGGK